MTGSEVTAAQARGAVADALDGVTPTTATPIEAGTNTVYRVETPRGAYVAKFNTYSEFDTLAAEVQVYRLLADADLPVPRVVDAELDPAEGPAYVVMAALPGETPTEVTPALAEQLGEYLHAFASIPPVEGYGRLHYDPERTPPLVTHTVTAGLDDTWRAYVDWYAGHICSRYADRFADLVDPVQAAVERRLTAVPRHPDPAIAYHDYRPANVHVDAEGTVVGVLDLERADLGDVRYTLVETEYLLTRHRPERAGRLRSALYEGFGDRPPARLRNCYRALAVAREIRGFDAWWGDRADADEKAANVRSVAGELLE